MKSSIKFLLCAVVALMSCTMIKAQSYTTFDYFTRKFSQPIIIAHRMAPESGYSENSVNALKHNLSLYPSVLNEVDVRITADGKAVLLHDKTLERTTTGQGDVSDYTYQQLVKFELKDPNGKVLKDQHIPLLSDILQVVKNKHQIVMLDMKPGTDPNIMMDAVRNMDMIKQVSVICYCVEDAQKLHAQYPNLLLALGFNSLVDLQKIKYSGLPFNQLIALLPNKILDKSYYDEIKQMGVPMSFGAQGYVDKQLNAEELYRQIFNLGIDIICTDHIERVGKAFFNK